MSEPTAPPPESPPEPARGRRPWWTYAVPYFGRTPDLSPGQWRILGLLVVAELFEHYDIGLLSMALVQIQEGLGIAEEDIGAAACDWGRCPSSPPSTSSRTAGATST